MSKAAKATLKIDLAERFKKANAAIVAEYRGLTVADLTELRIKLRASNSEFKIVKNRVAKVAIREDSPTSSDLSPQLKGPVGVVFIYGDPAAAAKSVLDFAKDKPELFKVTGGLMEGKGLTEKELKAIADLPSKEVLLAKIVGSLVAPHRGLVSVMAGVPRQLVQVINAIKEKKA
jgi:large subunit ribosomal protein L10